MQLNMEKMNIIVLGKSKIRDVYLYPPKSWKNFFKSNEQELDNIEHQLEDVEFLPPKSCIFSAFYNTSFKNIKIVILGQDPYYTPGYADGLSFSCRSGKIPDSLQNIFKVLQKTVKDWKKPSSGNLTAWAKRGIFLINASLTVVQNKPKSHLHIWENFTLSLLEFLNQKEGLVYMLWGNVPQKYERYIDSKKNLILKTSHPSPQSASLGFLSCDHFNQANAYLKNPVDWSL